METKSHEAFSRAFQIFSKYEPNQAFVTGAEHDIIYACETNPERMSSEDVQELDELSWHFDEDLERWYIFT